MGPQLVTPEDHDAGFKDLPLTYRRGPTSDELPATIRIRALSYVEAAAINLALARSGTGVPPVNPEGFDENVWRLSVLLAALPEPHNNVEFVNRLKPTCVDRLMVVALHMAYGTPETDGPSGQDQKKSLIDSAISAPA